MEALLIAVFGGAAVLIISAAVWLPIHARESTMRRRIDGFVDTTGATPTVIAGDIAGRARRRVTTSTGGKRNRFLRFVEKRIAKAQMQLSPEEASVGVGLAAVTAFVVATVLWGLTLGFVATAAVPLFALAFLSKRAAGVQTRFSDQLADTVGLLATSVRTGHSVLQALEHVSREAPEPTRSAFALVVREIGLGASLEDALARLLERYPSEDMDLIATSINIHSYIGGSLVKILEAAGDTIRERSRMIAEVKALTSQQRYSAYVLALMPVFILLGMRLVSPDYVEELFKATLRIALIGAGVLVLAGFLVMQRMSNVD